MYTILAISLLIAIFLIDKRHRTANPSFTIERTSILKALLPFIIILGHCSLIFGGCRDFTKTGALVVAIFFFISGYGLQVKHEKQQLNCRYLKKRIIKLFVPIAVPAITFALLLYSLDQNNFLSFYTNYKSWNILLPFTWFVTKLIVLYILFFISIKIRNHYLPPPICIVIEIILLDFILIYNHTSGHIYISDAAFVGGIWFRQFENKIVKHTILISMTCLVITSLMMPFSSSGLVYMAIITLVSLAIPALLCNMKIKNSAITRHLSGISYELYLCQGIAFIIVRHFSAPLWVLYLSAFGITYITAIVCHGITLYLQKISTTQIKL